MTLYRADPKDGVAWITGASTGMGRQLALDLADEGYVVAATARDGDGLATLVREADGKPGRIAPYLCDVSEERNMDRTVARIEKELGPIVLAVFNAGIYSPTIGRRLETYNFASTFNVNLLGAMYGLVPVADRMHARGFGHVALIGSVTAYFGLPTAAAYCGSKAALNAIAQSLRYDFDALNIRLQIVNPGFVATPLTARHSFPMPALIPVEEASRRIARGLRTGGFEIAFPRRLIWPAKAMSLLPVGLTYRVMRLLSRRTMQRKGRRKNGR